MKRQIDFFIVGAPKAGTDSLRNWLNKCSMVRVYGPQEPNYFCTDILGEEKSVDDWTRKVLRQARGHKIVGEKSTWYLGSEAAIRNISDKYCAAKIIILVRDHVPLFLSLHSELVKLGVETELDPLRAWHATLKDPKRLDFDNLSLVNYPQSCQIGRQIDRWIDAFGHERVLIGSILDLETDAGRARFARFLGVLRYPNRPAAVANQRISRASQSDRVNGTLRRATVALGKQFQNLLKSGRRFLRTGRWSLIQNQAPRIAYRLPLPDAKKALDSYFVEDCLRLEVLRRENAQYHP
nr:hypothetical protein [uncultured Celeribacter sp.]